MKPRLGSLVTGAELPAQGQITKIDHTARTFTVSGPGWSRDVVWGSPLTVIGQVESFNVARSATVEMIVTDAERDALLAAGASSLRS